jgi:hypothetical protein
VPCPSGCTTTSDDRDDADPAVDADADRVDDLLVGAPRDDVSDTYLFPVTADGDGTDADAVFGGDLDGGTGTDVDLVSDFDGDGGADFLVCCRPDENEGRA